MSEDWTSRRLRRMKFRGEALWGRKGPHGWEAEKASFTGGRAGEGR